MFYFCATRFTEEAELSHPHGAGKEGRGRGGIVVVLWDLLRNSYTSL
jgi:hypothetical protein